MKKNLPAKAACMAVLLLFTSLAFAQNIPVSGRIINSADGSPLAGATIHVKGANITEVTKQDGTFQINVPAENSILVISFVGFKDMEVPVGTQRQFSLSLVPSESSLEDVVVIGYGTRKRVEVTGATSSVSGESLRTVQTTNLTSALQGRVAGVTATQSSFRPGGGSSIRIRGNRSLSASNEPLFVVDGFPVSYTIDDMNPADIESVDVLKDAAATAVYGVRGANGVIQITTRKGKTGKISISYQGSQSVESIISPLPVFNSIELTDAQRQAFFADTAYTRNITKRTASNPLYYYPDALADLALFKNRFGSLEQWNSIKDAYTWVVYDPVNNIYIPKKRATTDQEKAVLQSLQYLGAMRTDSIDIYDPSQIKSFDWLNEVGLRNGRTSNHSISVTGGGDKFKASFNAGYFKQTGIEYAQDYTRFSVGNSVEFRPAKFITFGATINYIRSITNTSTSSYANASGMIPMVGPYDTAGNWILYPNRDAQIVNAVNDRKTVMDQTTVNRVFGNVYAEVALFKGLKYRTMFGLDTRNSIRGTFNGAQSSVRGGSPASASQTTNTATS